MNIRFIVPGKCREKPIKDGQEEYLKRLIRYAKISFVSVTEESVSSSPTEKEIEKALSTEAERILKLIKPEECLFLVDVHAKNPSTEEFASEIKRQTAKNGNLVFVVGSSYGLSDALRKRADYSFSLGKMTFTHYMAMYLVIEQVYRAMKINHGEHYDK